MSRRTTPIAAHLPALLKCPSGVRGLDEITNGGIPRGRPTLVCGSAGSGKTLLAMEFLVRGIQDQASLLAAVQEAVLASADTAVVPMPRPDGESGGVANAAAFDGAIFEDSTEYLSPADVREHVRALIARAEALREDLRAPGLLAKAGELAEGTHRLAGNAAMLGFSSLANAGRRFEAAADAGDPEIVALGDALTVAIDAAVTIMRVELADWTNPAR